jgi:hypothetical protein
MYKQRKQFEKGLAKPFKGSPKKFLATYARFDHKARVLEGKWQPSSVAQLSMLKCYPS